jgi:DNA repair photolyase
LVFKGELMSSEYTNCLSYTTQFVYCPAALRLDSRRGCQFSCEYCFSNIFLQKIAGKNVVDYSKFSKPAGTVELLKAFRLAGHEQ